MTGVQGGVTTHQGCIFSRMKKIANYFFCNKIIMLYELNGAQKRHQPLVFNLFYLSVPGCIHLINMAIGSLNCLEMSVPIP